MTIITELADGRAEIFETSNYVISKTKDFHPLLCKVSIYDNGKKIKSVSREQRRLAEQAKEGEK